MQYNQIMNGKQKFRFFFQLHFFIKLCECICIYKQNMLQKARERLANERQRISQTFNSR